jgi:uncharacterized membrane protein YdbT with pleckstrin-like domain
MTMTDPIAIQETRIREVWPSVARSPAIAAIGKMLTKTIILAPLAWLVMGGIYFLKVLPIFAIRYKLTDERIMIVRGWGAKVSQAVALSDIDDVQLDPATVDHFFRSADLKIISGGKVAMTLTAVPDAEAFRHAILDSRNAWAPGKAKKLPFISAAVTN